MEGPCTWVVCLETDDCVPTPFFIFIQLGTTHSCCRISAHRVSSRANFWQSAVELSFPGAHNPETMAMEMPRMTLAYTVASRIILQDHFVHLTQLQLVEEAMFGQP